MKAAPYFPLKSLMYPYISFLLYLMDTFSQISDKWSLYPPIFFQIFLNVKNFRISSKVLPFSLFQQGNEFTQSERYQIFPTSPKPVFTNRIRNDILEKLSYTLYSNYHFQYILVWHMIRKYRFSIFCSFDAKK